MSFRSNLATITMTGLALSVTACGPQANTSATTRVSSSFKMTGSSSPATVAQNKCCSPLSWLLPSASALTPPSLADSTGLSVTLSSAWVVIRDIEFEQAETRGHDEVDGAEVEFTGPYPVDLLSTTPMVLDTQAIPALPYKRIKMKLHKAEGTLSGIPAQLINNSIYLAGSVAGNSFTYQADDTTEFEIGGATPVLPTDGGELLVAINLANVIKQINLSSLPNGAAITASNRYAGAGLCPSIDSSAADVYTCIRKGLQQHSDFGEDKDGNDDLDATDDHVK